jgi:diguanylate cyclase (GGDEF)-like protein/PAS domain S-box-containing protein
VPGKATVAAALSVVLLVGGGALGGWSLLSGARDRYHAANTAADLKFDLAQLSSMSDDFASSATSDLALQIDALQRRVNGEATSLSRNQVESADLAALAVEVRGYVASVEQQRLFSQQGQPQRANALAASNDVAFNQLALKSDAELAEIRGLADRYLHDAELLGTGLGLLVLVAVSGAVWWDGRRRRWAERDGAERRNRARFEAMVEHGSDLLLVTFRSGADTYVCPALEHLLGYPPDSSAAKNIAEILDPEERPKVAVLLEQALTTGRAGPSDCRVRHADGSWRTMEVTLVDLTDVAEVGGVLWSARDVTERRELEHQLERSAFSDPLTGLANRTLFRERLDHAVAREARGGHPIAVLLADLDGFKAVNDSLGHDAGDKVLVEVAARLAGCLRSGDTAARLGGDEFAIILEDVTEPAVAERVADRMLEIMRQTVRLGDADVRVGVSIGMAQSVDGTETGPDLLRNADIAMYSAKSNGRGQWATFKPIMHRRAEERLRLSSDLAEALARGELEVHYQPTLSIATGEVQGAEALLRWHHPTQGLLQPTLFIPIAEETGHIVPIGRWVLHQACRQAQRWNEQFPDAAPLGMSVNLSGRQLGDDALVADVAAVLADTAIDPATVVLEITESVLMDDVEAVTSKLRQLKDLGVRLAIDDFGTGYSSLAYLRQFPVDILKIDRTFVEAASSGAAGGEALVRAVVDLSASLHLATIAEGIEQQDQADLMLALGCPTGQGYLYARPMPPQQLEPLLAARTPRFLEPVN